MTPQKQLIQGDPQRRAVGDCFRACLASILDTPILEVPHFFEGLAPGEEVPSDREAALHGWLAERGLTLILLPVWAEETDTVLDLIGDAHPHLHYLLSGLTIKGVSHCVVAKGREVVHDPASPALGLFAPHDNGPFVAYFIGKLV